MTTVRTPCPGCGGREVDVAAEGILLLFREELGEGTYCFMCPSCDTFQDKVAERRVAMVLIAANVPWEEPT